MRIKTGKPIDPGFFGFKGESVISPVTAIATDSREIRPGDLFLALPGKKTDGAAHIAEAFSRGAAAVVSSGDGGDPRVLKTPDPLGFITRAAENYAETVPHKTVAITGSYGKTTLRAALETVLSPVLRLRCTEGNGNTDLAVALTLFTLSRGDELLIAELGMRGRGEIARLSRLVKPDVAVITAVGQAHVGLLGSVDAIREAKCEIALGIKENGILLYPASDYALASRVSRLPVRSEGVSCDPERRAAFSVTRIEKTGERTLVSFAGQKTELRDVILPSSDAPTLSAAAFCFAVAENLRLDPETYREGLTKIQPPPLRREIETITGVIYILDCYNASPEPTFAALSELRRYGGKRLFLVLGDMLELGALSDIAHETVGRRAAALAPERLYCVGERAKGYAKGAIIEGLSPERVRFVSGDGLPELGAELKNATRAGDVVFIKGSRELALERLVRIVKQAVS